MTGYGCRDFFILFLLVVLSGKVAASDETAISDAVEYLLSAQQPSGLYRYEHDFITARDSKKNNIVRQAGAVYALAEYYSFSGDQRVLPTINRSLTALSKQSLEWRTGRLVALDGELSSAKAGATALALLAVLMVNDDQWRELENSWLAGLLALQQQGGGFSSRPTTKKESPYSNGEIWLALALYNDRYPKNHWVSAALERADRHMLEKYGQQPDVGFFHWGVMATSLRWSSSRKPVFQQFVASQLANYMEILRPRISPRSNSCYAVEGLAAGLAALDGAPNSTELQNKTRQRIDSEMEKNRLLQITSGQNQINFGSGRYLFSPEVEHYAGAFLNGRYRPQVRIDATQHCLSALIKVNTR